MSDEQDRVVRPSDLRALSGLLERISSESEKLRQHVDARIVSETERLRQQVDARIASEGQETRRHFDVAAERIESLVKLVAEVNSHHATVLDDHEHRLQKIEEHS